MQVTKLASLLEILEISQLPSSYPSISGGRNLQFVLPDYTSPPLQVALDATPEASRSNETIDAARALDAAGQCVGDAALANAEACQIKFVPENYYNPSINTTSESTSTMQSSKVGVIFFGGALVDPRGYSPLMRLLSDTYDLPVSVPIFVGDMPFKFGTCESGRLAQAKAVFPDVEKWIFVGHSMGGIAAFNDVWAMAGRNASDTIGGLVLLASYVRQDLGCGLSDFSGGEWDWLPLASVSASEDLVVNATNFEAGQDLLPMDSPKFINEMIEGGNHGGFGSYDYSERVVLLNQVDGNATITEAEQQEQTADIIYRIALMVGGDDDTGVISNTTTSPTETASSSNNTTSSARSISPTETPSGQPSEHPSESSGNGNAPSNGSWSPAGLWSGCAAMVAASIMAIDAGIF